MHFSSAYHAKSVGSIRVAAMGRNEMTTRKTAFRTIVSVAALAASLHASQAFAQAADEASDDSGEIIVTGITTKNRPALTASVDVTFATAEDIARKDPKSVADALELVPGIFVEGTAGGQSNNYSVRGLQGGGQRFVTIEEDGMPILYGGGGLADAFFSHDITIGRLEAIRGGTSGILSVNGAGATINFISKPVNFDEAEGIARLTARSYGERRADFYYSGPLSENLAFSSGGYISSSPGPRKNPFTHSTYHLKTSLEWRSDGGGFIRLTGKVGDQSDAYYAGQPYRVGAGGKITGVAGLDSNRGNINGTGFGQIDLPVSTFVSPDGLRPFRSSRGLRAETWQLRLDLEQPVSDEVSIFARVRHLDLKWDFNGLFPGSGVGNAGLTSALNYLTPGNASPINGSLLQPGLVAFPATVRFGIKNLSNGQIIASNNPAALNALNGNGLLEQTWLNHDQQDGRDFGSNVGLRWEHEFGSSSNSLTAGVMYYNTRRSQNQAATAHVVNDVKNNSDIYDVVALDANNNVIGTLTNNGVVSYGEWGVGINTVKNKSLSVYINDELKIGDSLHIDFGVRHENFDSTRIEGNSLPNSQPVRPGTVGLQQNVGSAFDGTFSRRSRSYSRTAWTFGANYLITPSFAFYARYARGFQTNNVDGPVNVDLYEAGTRYHGHGLTASVTLFQTNFNNQNYGFIDPVNPAIQGEFRADLRTRGVEIDLGFEAGEFFRLDAVGVFQRPSLGNVFINGVAQPSFSGNRPERTPKVLYTITPAFILPNKLGEIYGRYKYVGNIFADSGNGLALPSYGVTSIGLILNAKSNLQFTLSADNLFSVTGLTEGNPRQGQTQNAASGLFYARGIVGTTYSGSVTLKF